MANVDPLKTIFFYEPMQVLFMILF